MLTNCRQRFLEWAFKLPCAALSLYNNSPIAKPSSALLLLQTLKLKLAELSKVTLAVVSVKTISQEAVHNFWRQKDLISSRSCQKGHCVIQSYIFFVANRLFCQPLLSFVSTEDKSKFNYHLFATANTNVRLSRK